MKLILNGWISPEGEIFECGRMEHEDLACDICNKENIFIDYPYIYASMWNNAYIRFFGEIVDKKAVIEFDDSYMYVNEITEAQKMAQAKLLKKVHQYNKKGDK